MLRTSKNNQGHPSQGFNTARYPNRTLGSGSTYINSDVAAQVDTDGIFDAQNHLEQTSRFATHGLREHNQSMSSAVSDAGTASSLGLTWAQYSAARPGRTQASTSTINRGNPGFAKVPAYKAPRPVVQHFQAPEPTYDDSEDEEDEEWHP